MARGKSPCYDEVMQIRADNPDWPTVAIHAEMLRRGRDMSYNCIRQIFSREGIAMPKVNNRLKWYDEGVNRMSCTAPHIRRPDKRPTNAPRASVHSYHGRSRLSASYTEL